MEEQHFPEEEMLALTAAVLSTMMEETNCAKCLLQTGWMIYANICKVALASGVELDKDREAERMREMLQSVHNAVLLENADVSTHAH